MPEKTQEQVSFWKKFSTNNPKTAKYMTYAAATAGAVVTGAAALMGVPAIFAEGATLSSVATGFAAGAGTGLQLSAVILAPVGAVVAGAEKIEQRKSDEKAEKRKKSMAQSMRQAMRDKSWQPSIWRKFRQKMPITSTIVKYSAIGIAAVGATTLLFGGGAKAAVAMRSAAMIAARIVVPVLVLTAVTDTVAAHFKQQNADQTGEKGRKKQEKAQNSQPDLNNQPKPSQKPSQTMQNGAKMRNEFDSKREKAPEVAEKGPKLSIRPKKPSQKP